MEMKMKGQQQRANTITLNYFVNIVTVFVKVQRKQHTYTVSTDCNTDGILFKISQSSAQSLVFEVEYMKFMCFYVKQRLF